MSMTFTSLAGSQSCVSIFTSSFEFRSLSIHCV